MTTNNPNTVLNATSSNGLLSNENKGVFHVPVLVAPKKIIVPVNNFGQTLATNCPPLKRFSNGDCKTHTYKPIKSENNSIGISQQTLLINTGKPSSNIPLTLQTACGSSSSSVLSAVMCPNCGQPTKNLIQCENCNQVISQGPTISVIRPVRTLTTVLCTNTNNSVTIMPSKTSTIGGGTVLNNTSILRTRPTIISGTKYMPVIPKATFYGEKLQKQDFGLNSNPLLRTTTVELKVSKPVTKTLSKLSSKSTIPKQPRTRKQTAKKPAEPECLTLSSDDEASSQSSVATTTSLLENEVSTSVNPNSEMNMENLSSDLTENGDKVNLSCVTSDCSRSANEPIKNNFHTYCQDPANDGIRLMCRSIRIGSYKIQSPDPPALALDITEDKISFSVPVVPNENEPVNITINRTQLASILACFEKRLFVLFLYTDAACGTVIRDKLKMTKDSVYYDPTSPEETKKRITILPANISDAERNYLRMVFEKPKMVELSQNKANEILVRSTPVGTGGSQHMVRLSVVDNNTVITRSKDAESSGNTNENPIVKLVTYPPPPQTGGILVTSEDLLCLNEGEYLNDVIIDFYLKYIYLEKLSKEDQKRTYIFSSFFYNRLSQTPIKSTLKNSAKMSPKELRHSRVKTWTRHVDIFEKDFLIVPVNQMSHWFLVVICFPRKVSADYIPEVKEKKNVKSEKEPDNVQVSKVSNSEENVESNSSEPAEDAENSTDSPYAGATDQLPLESSNINSEAPMDIDTSIESTSCNNTSEVFHQSSDASSTLLNQDTSAVSNTDAKIQEKPLQDKNVPCIIIFDSLPGASRWRVVASLREYLEIEHLVKKKVKKFFDRESMKGLNAKVCRQSNFSDCGVFLLQYAESFFEDPLESFTMPLKDLSNWFSMDIINNKREMIKKLILELSNSKSK